MWADDQVPMFYEEPQRRTGRRLALVLVSVAVIGFGVALLVRSWRAHLD